MVLAGKGTRVVDRNVLTVPEDDIANVEVLQTVVGGILEYQAADPGAAR